MTTTEEYEKEFALLPKKADLPKDVLERMDADLNKALLEDALKCIAQYCMDFCKKEPMLYEGCIYDYCPLHKYRLGKL